MFFQISFIVYFLILILTLSFLGINYYRIQNKQSLNPKIYIYLLPFIFNFIIAKSIFYDINPFFTTLMPCLLIYFMGRKLQNVRILGLTGGIATGKSTLVKNMKKNLNKLTIIDCDQIAKQLRGCGNKGYNLIIKILGQNAAQFLESNKELKRQKLSNYVFQNQSLRKTLTVKMGRLIMWEILKQILKSIFAGKNLILIDAPILYESKILEHFCYPIIVVGCSQQMQIKRLLERNQYNQQQAKSRIKSQMPLAIKKKKCDIYVKNQGSQQDLLKNTLVQLNKYLQKKEK